MKTILRVKRVWMAALLVSLVLTTVLAVQAEERVFVWQVSWEKNTSYVMGSIHLLKKEFYPLPQVIEKAFADSQVLAVEANLSPEKAMEVAALTMKRGMYSGEDTLKDHISEKTYRLAGKVLKEMDMDIEELKKLKPWMLAMTVESMQLLKKGFDPNYGVDMHFLKKAAKEKEIVELEGIGFQIDLFESFTPKESDLFLFFTLQEASAGDEKIGQMTEAWARGDAAAVENFVTRHVREYPELKGVFDKLFDERNFKMADKIAAFLKTDKTHFVVVGAGHLVGKNGVLQLLRDKGFKVKQL
jgi:uncharacterized protein YbaP (TraB family)